MLKWWQNTIQDCLTKVIQLQVGAKFENMALHSTERKYARSIYATGAVWGRKWWIQTRKTQRMVKGTSRMGMFTTRYIRLYGRWWEWARINLQKFWTLLNETSPNRAIMLRRLKVSRRHGFASYSLIKASGCSIPYLIEQKMLDIHFPTWVAKGSNNVGSSKANFVRWFDQGLTATWNGPIKVLWRTWAPDDKFHSST